MLPRLRYYYRSFSIHPSLDSCEDLVKFCQFLIELENFSKRRISVIQDDEAVLENLDLGMFRVLGN